MDLIRQVAEDLQHNDVEIALSLGAKTATSNTPKVGDTEVKTNPQIEDAINELNKLITALEFSDDENDKNIVIQATALRDSLKQELSGDLPDRQPAPQPGINLTPQIFTNIG